MTEKIETKTGKKPDFTNKMQGVALWVNKNKDGTKQYISGTLQIGSLKIPFSAFPDDYNENESE